MYSKVSLRLQSYNPQQSARKRADLGRLMRLHLKQLWPCCRVNSSSASAGSKKIKTRKKQRCRAKMSNVADKDKQQASSSSHRQFRRRVSSHSASVIVHHYMIPNSFQSIICVQLLSAQAFPLLLHSSSTVAGIAYSLWLIPAITIIPFSKWL